MHTRRALTARLPLSPPLSFSACLSKERLCECVCVCERETGGSGGGGLEGEKTLRAPVIRWRFDGRRLETIWRGDEFNTNSSQRRSRPTWAAPAHLPGNSRPLPLCHSSPSTQPPTRSHFPPAPTLEVSVFVCIRNAVFKREEVLRESIIWADGE